MNFTVCELYLKNLVVFKAGPTRELTKENYQRLDTTKQKFKKENARTENSVYTRVGNREMGYKPLCNQDLGY